MSICIDCSKEFEYSVKARKAGYRRNMCNSCSANRWKISRKKKAVAYKGGKCQICGYDKCLRALGFHHVNGQTKSFAISGSHCRSWTEIKIELDKCVLLCSNCHGEAHEGLIASDTLQEILIRKPFPVEERIPVKVQHGMVTMYNRGCRCEPCKESAKPYRRKSYIAHQQERRDWSKNYRLANRDKILMRRKELYKLHSSV